MNYNYPQMQYQTQSSQNYSGYRQMPQQLQWGAAINSFPQVRPVSSIEEVKACPIDFDGSIFYFTDIANKKIYTKYINLDGTASIKVYELKENVSDHFSTEDSLNFVTKHEFENVINELKEMYKNLENEKESLLDKNAAQPVVKKPLFEI